MVRLGMPLFFLVLSVIYLILTFGQTKSKVGDPNAPLYFPAIIGVFLLLMSVIYLVQEWKKRAEEIEAFKQLKGNTLKLMIATLVLIFIYTFLFERIGFLISTMIFLGGLLFVVNGRKKWMQNILIAVIFSFVSWYSFAELLRVSLP
mgnify:FL=1